MATPKLIVPPSPLIRTKGPADVPISPSPSARIGPTGNVGASGPTTDKRGHRRCFRDGMPIGCIEMNAEVKDLAESDVAVKEPEEKPKPIRRTQQRQPAQPQQQPRQEAVQPRNPQVQPSQRRPVPTDRLARETLRNVTDGDYSDKDRQQVSELTERVGEEGHERIHRRLTNAAHYGGEGEVRGTANAINQYLRDRGQIRERGTAPQEQIRQPAPDEQYAGGREPRQESSKEEYLQEKERRQQERQRESETEEQRYQRLGREEAEAENRVFSDSIRQMEERQRQEESSRSWQEALDDEEVHDVAEVPEEEDWSYQRDERPVYEAEAAEFGFDDPDQAAEIGIEDPKTFEYLRNVGIENKQTLDSIGGGSALEGAQTVLHEVMKYRADISIKHKYIKRCDRSILVDEDGNRYMVNEYFRTAKNAPKGTGLRVFEDQVKTAIENGFVSIETNAAGNKSSAAEGNYNGYITWAKFGYDQPKAKFKDKKLLKQWNEDWPDAESVQDIMAEDGGPEWWEEHGQSMEYAEFDLTEGSRSRYVFEEYIAAKKAKGEYLEGLIKSYRMKAMPDNDTGAEPISMDEANDPVLNQIHSSLGKGMKQPGVPFQGPSGRWFVYSAENKRVVPTKDPNAVEEEQPQTDPQFQEDWNQVAEQAIDEIEQADVSDYQYTAQEVAAEQDWHRQLIEWRGSGSEPAPQDAGIISRAISGFLNPVLGGVGYVDGLVREFAIPNQKDDITQGLLAELDRINPGGKGNAIIASLVGWLFGAPAVEVTKKMPTVPTQEQPEEQPPSEQTEESQPLPDPEKDGPPTAIQQRMNADPEFAQDWERMEKKRQKHRKRAANAPKRLDKLTPEERQQRAERAYLKLQKKEIKRAQRSAKWWAQRIQKGEIAPMDILQDGELLSRHPELKEVALERLKKGQKDLVPGGLCQNCSPDDFDQEQLQMGIEVEMEHTSDCAIAQEIAMDHLTEDAHYYSKLKKVGGKDMSWLANDRGGALVPPPSLGLSGSALASLRKPTLKVNKGYIQDNPLS